MVGYDSKSGKLKPTDVAFAGAGSGFITRALCQPLDVIKIRFQLQVEPISHRSVSKYRSFIHAVVTICREEGFKAFWKGHVPAQYLSISYGLIQFWTYEELNKKIGLNGDLKRASDFYCGAAAGSLATIISFPFDVCRTRLVAQWEHQKEYRNWSHVFQSIVKKEGYVVLFRGLLPTIIQVAQHTGVQFMCYKFFESIYNKIFIYNVDKSTNVFSSGIVCGSLAGFVAKTSVYPFDLSRKRLQIQGFDRKYFGKNFVCDGFIDSLKKTYQYEGVTGLFKGLGPSLIKAVLTSALHFSMYDLICYKIAKYRKL